MCACGVLVLTYEYIYIYRYIDIPAFIWMYVRVHVYVSLCVYVYIYRLGLIMVKDIFRLLPIRITSSPSSTNTCTERAWALKSICVVYKILPMFSYICFPLLCDMMTWHDNCLITGMCTIFNYGTNNISGDSQYALLHANSLTNVWDVVSTIWVQWYVIKAHIAPL